MLFEGIASEFREPLDMILAFVPGDTLKDKTELLANLVGIDVLRGGYEDVCNRRANRPQGIVELFQRILEVRRAQPTPIRQIFPVPWSSGSATSVGASGQNQ